MMDIQIFQINHDRDTRNLAFMGLDHLTKDASAPAIDSTIYDRVYAGSVHAKNLEDVFHIFNREHPVEFFGRSLSVSDIVEVVDESNGLASGFYFCDHFGFSKVAFDADKAQQPTLIKGVLLEPGREARPALVQDSLYAYQRLVGGYLECAYPFDDNALILCNEEGKLQKLPVNRTLRDDEKTIDMDYSTMRAVFRSLERSGSGLHANGYIVFSPDSFTEEYSLESRTYVVSSDNKAFQPNKSGKSIFASSLDNSDVMIRLEQFMTDEQGGKDGWKIERCYMKEPGRVLDVLVGNVFICGQEDGDFVSLNEEQLLHYQKAFRYPEHIYLMDGEIKAESYIPKGKTAALKDLVSDADHKRISSESPGKKPEHSQDVPDL